MSSQGHYGTSAPCRKFVSSQGNCMGSGPSSGSLGNAITWNSNVRRGSGSTLPRFPPECEGGEGEAASLVEGTRCGGGLAVAEPPRRLCAAPGRSWDRHPPPLPRPCCTPPAPRRPCLVVAEWMCCMPPASCCSWPKLGLRDAPGRNWSPTPHPNSRGPLNLLKAAAPKAHQVPCRPSHQE